MQQFIGTQSDLQQRFSSAVTGRHDTISVLPTGMGWLDAVPPETFLNGAGLAIIVYPNSSLLHNHALRLRLAGVSDENVALLTNEMPPNAERDVWDRISRHRVSMLLITARKLQSVTTLSQLTRQPLLGPIVIEQAHLAVTHLWGPVASAPYAKLAELFRTQWTNHPPMLLFSGPMPQQYMTMLQSAFNMGTTPHRIEWLLPIPQLQLDIRACVTQQQKMRLLTQFVAPKLMDSPTQSSATIVVCATLKQVLDLERRLIALNPLTIHRQLAPDEKELRLMQPLHERQALIIIERDMLPELPTPLFFLTDLKIAHWQLPWSCEAMTQQVLLATRQADTPIQALVLYTKEDFAAQKDALTSHYSEHPAQKGITLDHLTRIRHAAVKRPECRRVQMENWLWGFQPKRQPCGVCDRCIDPPPSSLWRKCLNAVLY